MAVAIVYDVLPLCVSIFIQNC